MIKSKQIEFFNYETGGPSYTEYNRDTQGKVSNITTYTDSSMTQKIKEVDFTRSGDLMVSYTVKLYDNSGVLYETLNHVLNRDAQNRVSNIEVSAV